jgi:hypothetical protein
MPLEYPSHGLIIWHVPWRPGTGCKAAGRAYLPQQVPFATLVPVSNNTVVKRSAYKRLYYKQCFQLDILWCQERMTVPGLIRALCREEPI